MDEKIPEPNQSPRSPFSAIRAIDYTVIFVRDMPAVRRFHEDVLAFPRHILQKVPSEIRELFTLR